MEVVWLELDEVELVIYAMALRQSAVEVLKVRRSGWPAMGSGPADFLDVV